MFDILKKAAKRHTGSASETEMEPDSFAEAHPGVFAFLAANVDGQGELRERSKLQLFIEGGQWKACLMDPHVGASLFVTVTSPLDMFKAVEKALDKDRPDWRVWKEKRKR